MVNWETFHQQAKWRELLGYAWDLEQASEECVRQYYGIGDCDVSELSKARIDDIIEDLGFKVYLACRGQPQFD